MTGTYPNQVLTEQTDTRPLTRWIADPNGAAMSTSDGPVDYELDLGDPAGEVRIEVINESGQIRTGINATRRIPIGPYRVKVTVTNGVGTIVVPTSKARLVQVESNDFFRLENPITVSVADTEF